MTVDPIRLEKHCCAIYFSIGAAGLSVAALRAAIMRVGSTT